MTGSIPKAQITSASAMPGRDWLWPIGIAIFYLIFWPLYYYLSSYNLDQHGDMVENHAWGIAWQWGYFKHPPLYSWIVAAWFEIAPRTDYSYRTLSALNGSVTIVLIWLYARRIVSPVQAVLVAASLFFLPTTTFLASNYNATSAMLPFWAGTFLAYLIMLERRTMVTALLFGFLAGCSILIKYHSGMLVLALLAHAIYERELRAFLASRILLGVVAGGMLPVLPHLYWLVQNDFASLSYATHQENGGFAGSLYSVVRLVPAMLLYSIPVFAFYLIFFRRRGDTQPLFAVRQITELGKTLEGRAFQFALAGPILLTSLAGLALQASISTLWSIPFFAFVPVLFILLLPEQTTRNWRTTVPVTMAGYAAVLLVATPFIYSQLAARSRSNSFVPVREIAAQADAFWSEHVATPWKIAGGENFLSNAATFYAPDRPMGLQGMSLQLTPWLNAADITTNGILLLCREGDEGCMAAARQVAGAIDAEKTVVVAGPAGSSPETHSIRLMLKKPAGA